MEEHVNKTADSSNSWIEMIRERTKASATRPVAQKPWGGANCTELQLEIYPDAFIGAILVAIIEKGYVDTDMEPDEWVDKHTSGLALERWCDAEDGSEMRYFFMHIDSSAVKDFAPFPYGIFGYGGGEYNVAVGRINGSQVETLFQESYCCK